jgi:rubrerythrin
MEHELSPVFSNLAQACEKQYRSREAELFWKASEYFDGSAAGSPKQSADTEAQLAESFGIDETDFIAHVRESAIATHDRGALRMATWATKVNAIQKSVAERYAKKGDTLLEGKSIFVCEACGFIFIGDEPPYVCPVCKAPALRFSKIE